MEQGDDQENLIYQIRFGEQKSVNEGVSKLLEKSKGIVAKIVSVGGGNEEDIQSILNEAVTELYLIIKKGSFDPGRANWTTLIYSIAKNKWLSRIRKEQRLGKKLHFLNPEVLLSLSYSESPADSYIFKQEDREKIHMSLRQLGPTCREFMKMKYLTGASIRVICEKIGISESAAKQRHKRCKEKLKHIFGKDPRFE